VSTAAENMRAAGLMSLAMAFFTLNDACMKALSDELPIGQALTLRGFFSAAILGIWAWRSGALRLGYLRRDWLVVLLRTIGEAAAAFLFITALFHMPLANATAILQALPLVVTLASAFLLGEKLGWRRIAAIAIGFVGVMIIVRPGPEGFNPYAFLALASVFAVSMRDIVTRLMSPQVPSLAVAFCAALGVLVLGLGLSIGEDWQPLTTASTLQMTGSTIFIIIGYVLSISVMRIGEIGFVAPFRYTGLLWALLLGLVAFGDFPSILTLFGAAIVVGTGVFTFYRERQLQRIAAS
jgi:drug/metabolite transporter (DMT)-like permease